MLNVQYSLAVINQLKPDLELNCSFTDKIRLCLNEIYICLECNLGMKPIERTVLQLLIKVIHAASILLLYFQGEILIFLSTYIFSK